MTARRQKAKKQLTVRLDAALHKALKIYLIQSEQSFQDWVAAQVRKATGAK